MNTEEIIRPEINRDVAETRSETCKHCIGSCRVKDSDGRTMNLVCATKSRRRNEIVKLSEGALAEDCESFAWRSKKSHLRVYTSEKEFFESTVTKLTDFFEQPRKWGEPRHVAKYAGRY